MKKPIISFLFFLVWVGQCLCEVEPLSPGWIKLFAQPEQYEGKTIYLSGWITLYSKEDLLVGRLFFSREALDYRDLTLGIVLESSSIMKQLPEGKGIWQEFNGERVLVVGKIRRVKRIPESAYYPFELYDIQRLTQEKPGSPIYSK